MSTIMDHAVEKEYLALVRAFPLLSIHNEEHLTEALAVIDRLTDKTHRSAAEDAYLNALTDLVETYENAHVEIPSVTPKDALRSLLEENGLTAEDVGSSPELAMRIIQHWLLAYSDTIEQEKRNDVAPDTQLFDIQPLTPTEQQTGRRYLATLLNVPPDALETFMGTISKEGVSGESRPANRTENRT